MIAPASGSPGEAQLTAKVCIHHRNFVVTQKALIIDRPPIQQIGVRNGMRMSRFWPGRRIVHTSDLVLLLQPVPAILQAEGQRT